LKKEEFMPHGFLTRREFTFEAALAILAGCVVTVAEGCGKDSPTTPTTPPADVSASLITGQHATPHVATITGAQITAGSAITLNIQGSAPHNHTVAISQADLTALKNRQSITKDSTNDANHQHTLTFTPA
jgi:hypothetical protein